MSDPDKEGSPTTSTSNATIDETVDSFLAATGEDNGNVSFELVPCVVIPDAHKGRRGSKHAGATGGGRGRRESRRGSWQKNPRPRQSSDRRDSTMSNNGEVPSEAVADEASAPELPSPDYSTVDEATALALVLEQLEHYFSVKNLCRDVFMRSYMDCEGWVPLPFVADFNCIRTVSTDLDLVRQCAIASELLEFNDQHDKVRLKNSWKQWLFPNPQNDGYGLPLWLKSQEVEEGADEETGGDGETPESTTDSAATATGAADAGTDSAQEKLSKLKLSASAAPWCPPSA